MRTIPRILIVEDEPAIAELIAVNLRHNGFQPVWAIDAETAQRELDEILPDAILLDWMLPGESGLTLARKWRASARTKAVPILMLTARGDEAEREVMETLVAAGATHRPNGLLVEVSRIPDSSLALTAAGLGPVTAAKPDFVFEVACSPYDDLRSRLFDS